MRWRPGSRPASWPPASTSVSGSTSWPTTSARWVRSGPTARRRPRSGCAAPVVLTNADLRVIASNRAEYLPGDLVRADEAWECLDVAADVFPAGAAWKLFSPALP